MHDYSLRKVNVLEDYDSEINGVKISEIKNKEIYALAIKEKNEKKATMSLQKHFGAQMPSVGKGSVSQKYNVKILRLSVDQLFLFFENKSLTEVQNIFKNLYDSFFITEQTDAWCGLKVSGRNIEECLIRVSPIDISLKNFPVNAFAKTMMEHLGTIMIRSHKRSARFSSRSI